MTLVSSLVTKKLAGQQYQQILWLGLWYRHTERQKETETEGQREGREGRKTRQEARKAGTNIKESANQPTQYHRRRKENCITCLLLSLGTELKVNLRVTFIFKICVSFHWSMMIYFQVSL